MEIYLYTATDMKTQRSGFFFFFDQLVFFRVVAIKDIWVTFKLITCIHSDTSFYSDGSGTTDLECSFILWEK